MHKGVAVSSAFVLCGGVSGLSSPSVGLQAELSDMSALVMSACEGGWRSRHGYRIAHRYKRPDGAALEARLIYVSVCIPGVGGEDQREPRAPVSNRPLCALVAPQYGPVASIPSP